MTCPWDGLAHVPSPFCEEALCAWIKEPANTWSNAGFLVVGLLILARARADDARHLRGLGWICLATAVGSAFYHASETFLGRVGDYAGMYLGGAYMLSVNVRRLLRWKEETIQALFWTLFTSQLTAMIAFPAAATAIYTIQTVFCCVALETVLFFRYGKVTRYRWLVGYWSAFLPGYGLWMLDRHRLWCDPGNHVFNGHAAWHLLNAVAFYFLYLYYRQFAVLRAAPPP